MIPVFDGHNDFLQRMVRAPQRRAETWLTAGSEGHIDLPRMRAGGMVGGLFAVYVPSPPAADGAEDARLDSPPYDLPLPAPVPCASAQAEAMAMVGQLMWMERTGTLSICRSTADIRAAMARDRIAAVLHFEGAEAIGPDLDALHLWL
ncbi:membrane dipeptidase [Albidovulum sp.]